MNQADQPESPVSQLVYRHKWKAILLPIVILTCAAIVILYFPRTYRSEARIFLQVGRESVGLDPTATTGAMIQLMQSGRDEEMTSAIDVLLSRETLNKVVEKLTPAVVLGDTVSTEEIGPLQQAIGAMAGVVKQGIGLIKSIDPVSDHEEAIEELHDNLVVDAERGSTVIKLAYEAKSPQLAQQVLAQLISVFQDEHLRIHRNQDSKQFFDDQFAELERQLNAANNAVREAKNELGIVSVEARRETLEGQLRDVELEKYRTQQKLATSAATLAELKHQAEVVPAREEGDRRTMPNSIGDVLEGQLYTLKVKQLDLKSRLQNDHPQVIAIDNQVAEAQALADAEDDTRQETTDRVNPIFEAISLSIKREESSKVGLEARLETLDQQWQMVMRDLKELNEAEVHLDDLTRQAEVRRKSYFQYADNFEQARIDGEMEAQRVSNLSIAQPAQLIEKPVGPSKPLVGISALLLAAAIPVALILISERLNTRLRSAAEAEASLELPVFATFADAGRGGQLIG